MKVWKLVSGILNIILFVFVTFQSCAAGIGNSLSGSEEVSGSAGVIVAVMLLVAGILSIVFRKSDSKGGHIAITILYAIGAVMGFLLAGSFSDLRIWAGWCLICLILTVLAMLKGNKKNKDLEEGEINNF